MKFLLWKAKSDFFATEITANIISQVVKEIAGNLPPPPPVPFRPPAAEEELERMKFFVPEPRLINSIKGETRPSLSGRVSSLIRRY